MKTEEELKECRCGDCVGLYCESMCNKCNTLTKYALTENLEGS